MKTLNFSVAALAAFGAAKVSAAGFEKATVWSGKYTGLGSAAVSSVGGGEALFFNPAGLARTTGENGDVQLNYSPTFGQYEGVVVEANKTITSERHNSPIFGATGAYKVTPQLGVGAGVFVSAGSRSDYQDIDYTNVYAAAELKPDAKTQMSVIEASLGAGYEVMPGLSVGASWRAAFVKAALSSPQVKALGGGNELLLGLDLNDLSDSNYSAFRAGVQYMGEGWGIGLNARSKIEFTAEGTASGSSEAVAGAIAGAGTNGTPKALQGGDVSISSQLPLQVEIGGHFELPSQLTLFTSYNWTDYSQVNQIDLVGKVRLAADYVGGIANSEIDLATAPFKTRWKDQHTIKAGLQWDGIQDLPIRVGYARVSQVTPNEYARATFAAPGVGQVFTAGAGYKINDQLKADGAFEYAKTSGDVSAADSAKGEAKAGSYGTSAFAIHTGLSYAF